MTPAPATKKSRSAGSANTAVLQRKILDVIENWRAEKKIRAQWEKFVKKMRGTDLKNAQKALAQWKQPSVLPKWLSLSAYLKWFKGEYGKRAALLDNIEPANPALRKEFKGLREALLRTGDALSAKEVDRLFRSDASVAEYLASLSVAQIESIKEAVRTGTVSLKPKVKQTLLKLLSLIQEEQFKREQDWMKTIGPLALGITNAQRIQSKIAELEALQNSLGSPSRR
jgi:hypothetical protein